MQFSSSAALFLFLFSCLRQNRDFFSLPAPFPPHGETETKGAQQFPPDLGDRLHHTQICERADPAAAMPPRRGSEERRLGARLPFRRYRSHDSPRRCTQLWASIPSICRPRRRESTRVQNRARTAVQGPRLESLVRRGCSCTVMVAHPIWDLSFASGDVSGDRNNSVVQMVNLPMLAIHLRRKGHRPSRPANRRWSSRSAGAPAKGSMCHSRGTCLRRSACGISHSLEPRCQTPCWVASRLQPQAPCKWQECLSLPAAGLFESTGRSR